MLPSIECCDEEYGCLNNGSGAGTWLVVFICTTLLVIGVYEVVKHCKDGERALKQTVYDSTAVNKKINDTIYVKTR